MSVLSQIQAELKCPKNQRNDFGKYNYRSCEDILESLKPVAKKLGAAITLSDDIVAMGDRFYIKATATLWMDDGKSITAVGWAREPLNRKGMDDSQVTGSASSYARKYALNGLFAIDDNKDADYLNKEETTQNVRRTGNPQQVKQTISEKQVKFIYAKAKECGFDAESIHAGIKRYFNKEHLENLTKSEMDELLLKFKNSKRKEA